jgi:hypothetical protein
MDMNLSDIVVLDSLNEKGGNFLKEILSLVKFIVGAVILTAMFLVVLILWVLINQGIIRF